MWVSVGFQQERSTSHSQMKRTRTVFLVVVGPHLDDINRLTCLPFLLRTRLHRYAHFIFFFSSSSLEGIVGLYLTHALLSPLRIFPRAARCRRQAAARRRPPPCSSLTTRQAPPQLQAAVARSATHLRPCICSHSLRPCWCCSRCHARLS